MDEKKLFLLDAYALIYRAYYAMMRSPRVTTSGLNTSAIFGFCNTLDDLLRKENPGYIAVCFDPAGGSTFRHEAYPEYKAQRDKQPEDITIAVPYIKRILNAYRIPVIEIPGYEADDIIGTLSRRAEARDFTTYMMTPDKDFGQLVAPRVFMYRPALGGKGFEIRGPREVCERHGIDRPEQVIDLLALEGDTSDNIPGCPGVGEKTAAKLIKEWDSVENLIEHADSLKGTLRDKVKDNAQQILFSKFLATIKTDVPMDISPEDLRRTEPDIRALLEIFSELEFKTLAARLTPNRTLFQDETPKPAQPSLFPDETPSPAKTESSHRLDNISIVQDPDHAADLLAEAAASEWVGFDLDALGDEAMRADIRGFAVAWNDRACYFTVPPFAEERRELLALLEPLLSNPRCTVVCHDVKRAMVVLRRENLQWTAPYFDTSVAHYLLQPEMKHDLPTVAFSLLQYKTKDYELTNAERKKSAPDADFSVMACERAAVSLALRAPLSDALKANDVDELFGQVELPFIPVLADMEFIGVRIDVNELAAISRQLTARVVKLEEQAYELAGEKFNIGSPMQVGEILFGKLQLDPKAKRTKRGTYSTTEEVLEKYAKSHPLVGLILEIRGLRKLLTTYVDALPRLINPATGRIHTTFNQIVTATGRISSTNPNLQNIPIRTEEGREIRRAIIADPDCELLSADYSQIELRLIADMSADPDMLEAFNEGMDVHRATAAKIFGKDPKDVTDDERRQAKTANFGIIYGISAFGLSERLGISRAEAKSLIEGYMRTYPRMHQYIDEAIEKARQHGYVTTVMGRKRYLPEINSRNGALRGYAERNAVNAPLQGSAADIIKVAMIRINEEIRRRGLKSRMIIQVHDELVFNVAAGEMEQMRGLVEEKMEGAYSGKVKLEVSCGTGRNWLEAH